MTSYADMTAYELSQLLQKREVSAAAVLESVIERIQQVEGSSGKPTKGAECAAVTTDAEKQRVHAYIAPLYTEQALESAKTIDERRAKGETLPPLAGIPLAVKDVFAVKGLQVTAASRILYQYIAPYTATAVKRLQQQGTVIVGKTNLDEFALGSSTESSAYCPRTRNPWHTGRVPGGSSGGSAASVAAGETILALGSDTAGSIRQPAAFCGVVGLKPTYGRVSRWGLLALSSSLDTVGPITRSVRDSAMMLQAIAGYDEHDWTTSTEPVPDYLAMLENDQVRAALKGLTIGIPDEYFDPEFLPPDADKGAAVIAAFEQAKDLMTRELGVKFKRISLPHTRYAIPIYFVISRVELASNLHRYDGIKFGYRSKEAKNPLQVYEMSRSEGFDKQPKQRILMGMHAASDDSANPDDTMYGRALKIRALIRRDFVEAFKEVQLIMSPTAPSTAFPFDANPDDVVWMQYADCLTVPANHAGNPAISVPCGFDAAGLPIGLQWIGPDFSESLLMQAAHAYEQATEWHKQHPKFS